MLRKNLFTMLLTMVLVLGIMATSFAAPGKGKGLGKFKINKDQNKWRAVQITDVRTHWAEQQIRTISSYGIILGYPDLTFKPNVPVKKYEAVLMIARACGFTGTFEADRSWDGDVPSWMTDCLNFAINEGILTEDEAENLNGMAPAKRYEVAVWANRAIGLEQDSEVSFRDLDEIPYFARPGVAGMFKRGYMIGYPGNFFQPNKPVTRAEMAVVLYRILEEDSAGNGTGESEALEIDGLIPSDGSVNVAEDTDELVVRFNLKVQPIGDLDSVLEGITVRNVTYGTKVDLDEVSVEGNTLTIKLDEFLASNRTYRVTIAENLIEAIDTGENFDGISGREWEFSTAESFRIVRLIPGDGADDVDGDDTWVLKAEFSAEIQKISGRNLLDAVKVYNRSEKLYVGIDEVEIDGTTLIITLKDPLEEGDTFEVTVKKNYIEEKDTGDNFEGIEGNDWRFTTR